MIRNRTVNRRYLVTAIPTLLALTGLARAADTAVTWDGSSGNWTDSSHWSLPAGEYPAADNPPGATYAVTINGGSADIANGAYTLDALDMSSGTSVTDGGFGSLTVDDSFSLIDSGVSISHLILNGNGFIEQAILPAQTDINGQASLLYFGSSLVGGISIGESGSLALSHSTSGPLTTSASIINDGNLMLNGIALTGYQGTVTNPVGVLTNNGTLTSVA